MLVLDHVNIYISFLKSDSCHSLKFCSSKQHKLHFQMCNRTLYGIKLVFAHRHLLLFDIERRTGSQFTVNVPNCRS